MNHVKFRRRWLLARPWLKDTGKLICFLGAGPLTLLALEQFSPTLKIWGKLLWP